MHDVLTVGVEEEYQIVDALTAELVSAYDDLLLTATPEIRAQMKPEFLQCVIECITKPCTSIKALQQESMQLRATAAALAHQTQRAIISAGTHPTGRWQQQRRTIETQGKDRYAMLEEVLQDVARSILIYGLHIHVGIEDPVERVQVFNQSRLFLPYILAWSANSPFWMGRYTGFLSYRTIVWASFPFGGMPEAFDTFATYQAFIQRFERLNSIREPRRIWWDIRIHHHYPTVEFRIADMPLHHHVTIGIAAFVQALVRTILDRTRAGKPYPIVPANEINENRWRAARYGIRQRFIDFEHDRELATTDLLERALDDVSPAAEKLGTLTYLEPLRAMLRRGALSGAEQQIVTYRQHYRQADVTRMLMAESLRDIDRNSSMLAAPAAFTASMSDSS